MKKIFILFLIFLILGIAYSYPLILNFNSSIPYTHSPGRGLEDAVMVQGDHLQLFYNLWLFKDFWSSAGGGFFSEPYQFSIPGFRRPFTTREVPLSLLFYIFSFFGTAAAYNCLVLLSFILCGLCMFLLADLYLKDTPASIAAGCIFTLFPFRLAQLFGGHPGGFLVFWIPLMVYLFELMWRKKRAYYGFLAGICMFLTVLEEPHLAYYFTLFAAGFWIWRGACVCFLRKDMSLSRFVLLVMPAVTGWALAAGYILFVKSSVYTGSIAGAGRGIAEIKLFSPVLKDFFLRKGRSAEMFVYPGISVFLAAAYAVFSGIKNKAGHKDGFPLLFYFLVFTAAVVLSAGPTIKWFPAYKFCYKFVPFFKFPRSPGRMTAFTALAVSLLAAYGVKMLFPGKRRVYKWCGTGLILLIICADFRMYPRVGLCRLVKGNRAYAFVQKKSLKAPVLEIPIWPGDSSWSSVYEYYTSIYRIPVINGYSAFTEKRYIDRIFWPLISINTGMLTEKQYRLLKRLNVKYILMHEEAYPQKVSPFPFSTALKNLKRNPYVRFIMNDGPVYLFSLADNPGHPAPPGETLPAVTGLVYECTHMPRRIGISAGDKDASGGETLFAHKRLTKPAHLVFGPWRLFPPGKYRIIYRLRGIPDKEDKSPFAAVEVTSNKGTEEIIRRDISCRDIASSYTDYELDVFLTKSKRLEFRIVYCGRGKIWADYIYILCAGEKDPVWHYQAEDLYHIGSEVYDKDAEGKRCIAARRGLDPKGSIIFGPYRRYPPGRYRVGWRLKTDTSARKAVCVLKVTEAYSDEPVAERVIKGMDFKERDRYEYKYLNIEIDKSSILEFKAVFMDTASVYVDSVKIKTRDSYKKSSKITKSQKKSKNQVTKIR